MPSRSVAKLKAYFVSNKRGLLIGESAPSQDKPLTVGAFRPGLDGNYYTHIFVGFIGPGECEYNLGFPSWWEMVKSDIKNGRIIIDDGFSFNPDDFEVTEAEVT